MVKPFWETTPLKEMTDAQWESVCDGCAKCCLQKFIDDDDEQVEGPTDVLHTGEEIHYTNIACHLLNTKSCACTQYHKRTQLVPDCIKLTRDNLDDIFFMPPSCSYRRLHEGRGLPSWHPLLNKGKKSKMHQAQMSVRNKIVSEADVGLDDFENYIVRWPLNDVD